MGARGPARVPTAVLAARGSTLIRKGRGAGEVQGPAGRPTRPSWLDVDGRKVWTQTAKMLGEMGILTRIDGRSLARYCVLFVEWRRAAEFVSKNGQVYPQKDDKGNVMGVKPWPQFDSLMKLSASLNRIEQQFGMTPAARANIQCNPKVEQDPFEALKAEFADGVAGKIGA